tara:strand:- start:46 stop:1170 length:1125 start_codon:yes stop_codon:yes gene_type:complete
MAYEIVEYVWLDNDSNLRSKSRTIGSKYLLDITLQEYLYKDLNKTKADQNISLKMQWSYDGSSTGQAPGDNSEIIIRPVYIIKNSYYNQKYNENNYYIALCQTFNHNFEPLDNNNYFKLTKYMHKDSEKIPYFGFEQEFFLMQVNQYNYSQEMSIPVGYNSSETNGQDTQQYYCANGASNVFERELVNLVYHHGLKSGLSLSGTNAEVAIGQWEIQVGPVTGIEACHQLWLLRFLLVRIAEEHNMNVSYHPKPLDNWNGSGLHTNFSNNTMRKVMENKAEQDKVYQYIIKYIDSLKDSHELAIHIYGEDNILRMTGECETASYDSFTYGVANRGASIRIPKNVEINKYGYIEDRRPGANADPYNIYSILMQINI